MHRDEDEGERTWKAGGLGARHADDADCVADLRDFAHGQDAFARAEEVFPGGRRVCVSRELRPAGKRGEWLVQPLPPTVFAPCQHRLRSLPSA